MIGHWCNDEDLRMRIVTWNIQWGRGADGVVDLARTRDTLAELGPLDVICLQEVADRFDGLPGGAGEAEVEWFETAFPEWETVYAPGLDVRRPDGGRSRFGNLILSRWPIRQAFRHLLPCPGDGRVPSMQRSCAEAIVELPAGPLRILTTHLEYYSRPQRIAQIEALRQLQAEAASQAIDPPRHERESVFAARAKPASAILCGDFNCEPQSAEHVRLGAPIDGLVPEWADAWSLVYPSTPHASTVGLHGAEWPDRQYCCDFFFVSGDLVDRLRSVRVEAATAASDHQPVILEIEV